MGLLDHFVESGVAAFLGRVLNHFDFVELVSTNHAAFFGTVRAGFLAVAGGIGEIFSRKLVKREDFIAVEVHKSRFSGRKDELTRFHAFKPKHILLEFRELSRGISGFVIEDMRRKNHFIAIGKVVFNEIIE